MFEGALFYLISFVAILSAIGVVISRSAIYGVLCLVVTMCMLAGLFVLLKAFLIATILVLVYAGAILVLFMFVVMLIDPKKAEKSVGAVPATDPAGRREPLLHKIVKVAIPVILFSQIILVIKAVPISAFSSMQGTSKAIGNVLFNNYILPFELTSFLILAAIVSVVVLAKKDAQ